MFSLSSAIDIDDDDNDDISTTARIHLATDPTTSERSPGGPDYRSDRYGECHWYYWYDWYYYLVTEYNEIIETSAGANGGASPYSQSTMILLLFASTRGSSLVLLDYYH